jgi:hypothetical protein
MPAKEIRYRKCLLSFFDLLGFREMVRSRPPKDIASLVGLFQTTGSISEESAEAFESKSFQFSDSIVRIMPLDSKANTEYPVGVLFHEVLAILHACFEMANHGVAVRGALTLGDVYASGSKMFGPAMVRAYELETRVAVYPRVIVDPVVIDALRSEPKLKKDTHSVSEEAGHLRNLLRRDRDGVWFIDFLYAARVQVDEPDLYLDLLSNNKKHIEATLQSRGALDDVALKALWCASYHNEVLDRLAHDGARKSSLKPYRIAIPARLRASLPKPERRSTSRSMRVTETVRTCGTTDPRLQRAVQKNSAANDCYERGREPEGWLDMGSPRPALASAPGRSERIVQVGR